MQHPAPSLQTEKEAVYTATLDPPGCSFAAPAGMPLLEAAERAGEPGQYLQNSCRNGTSRSCICQLVSGQVSYRIPWPGLSLDEKLEGFILPCVAYPLTDVVIQRPS